MDDLRFRMVPIKFKIDMSALTCIKFSQRWQIFDLFEIIIT